MSVLPPNFPTPLLGIGSSLLFLTFSPLISPPGLGPEADVGLDSTWETLKGIGTQPRAGAHLRSHDKFLAKDAMPSFPQRGTGITSPYFHIPPLAVARTRHGKIA